MQLEDLEDSWLSENQLSGQQERLDAPTIMNAHMPMANAYEPLVLMQSALDTLSREQTFRTKLPDFLLSDWNPQLRVSDRDPVTYLLKAFMYLSSNKMLNVSLSREYYTFFDWMVDNMSASLLDALLCARLPTTEACVEHILTHCLLKGNSQLARTILAKDNSILRTKVLSADTNENRIENNPLDGPTFNRLFAAAVRLDDAGIIRHFLEARQDIGRISPLWNAQSPQVVKLLLDHDARVNERHNIWLEGRTYSATAVIYATYYGNRAVVQSFIKHGADVNLAALDLYRDFPVTPLRVAINRAVRELEQWTESEDEGNDGLLLIKVLLEAGANVNTISCDIEGNLWTTPLSSASHGGHKLLSALLLDAGADVNTLAPDGSTALLGAVKSGHTGLVKMLLERGADVNTPGEEPMTCLKVAVKTGAVAIVELLLEAGANRDFLPTCLMTAVEKENAAIVKLLLKAGAEIDIRAVNSRGYSTIELAGLSTDGSEILKMLLEFGAQQTEEGGRCAQLVHAITRRDYLLARSVLDHSVALNHSHKFRSHILKKCIESGDTGVLGLLFQSGIGTDETIIFEEAETWLKVYPYFLRSEERKISPLGYAIVFQKLSTNTRLNLVSTMLDLSVDPNASLWPGQEELQPALHFLVDIWTRRRIHDNSVGMYQNEYFEPYLIKVLLERGACTNISAWASDSKKSETPLGILAGDCLWSKWFETLEIAKWLIKSGADVDLGGETRPLETAAGGGNLELTKLLLKHKASVNGTALALAIRRIGGRLDENPTNRLAIIDLLLEGGADVNTDSLVLTALQAAVYVQSLDLVSRLIDLGADINALGGWGAMWCAIHFAAGGGSLEIAHLLLEKGADVNASSISLGECQTALELAAKSGRLDMVQLLINAGADTHLPGSKRYRGAERLARQNGHMAVAKLLKDRFEDASWG